MVVLPFAVLAALTALASVRAQALGFARVSTAAAYVVGFVLWQGIALIVTEATSAVHALSFWPVAGMWTAALLGTLWIIRDDLPQVARGVKGRLLGLPAYARKHPLLSTGWLFVVAVGATWAFLVAAYPPSLTDSLVYHLTRVAHWTQNETVAPYATHYLAQIELAPLSEYNFALWHVLSGTDRFDGLLQLISATVCFAAVWECSRRLGLGPAGRLASVLLAASIPSLVLESASTQNNVFAAAIGLAAVVVATAPWSEPGRAAPQWIKRGVWMGAISGAAFLAKGTLLALVWPLVAALLIAAYVAYARQHGWATATKDAVRGNAAGLVALVVVAAPFAAQNIALFGSISGPVTAETLSQDVGMRASLANVVRATASQMRTSNGTTWPDQAVGTAANRVLLPLFDATGVDPDDRRYELGDEVDAFSTDDSTSLVESIGSNAIPLLLIALSAPCLVWLAIRRRVPPVIAAAALALVLGYLVFASMAKWSEYAPRYYVPWLVAWVPLVVLVLRRLPRVVGATLVVSIAACSLPYLLNGYGRSIIHPAIGVGNATEQRLASLRFFPEFRPGGEQSRAYVDVAHQLARSSCHRLGVNSWLLYEYPLWVALEDAGWHGTILHRRVRNETRPLAPTGPVCARIYERSSPWFEVDESHIPEGPRFGTFVLIIDPEKR
jgi:hypothetical protein